MEKDKVYTNGNMWNMELWFQKKWGFIPDDTALKRWFEEEPGAAFLLMAISSKSTQRNLLKKENVLEKY